jgi:hypothetical protein
MISIDRTRPARRPTSRQRHLRPDFVVCGADGGFTIRHRPCRANVGICEAAERYSARAPVIAIAGQSTRAPAVAPG